MARLLDASEFAYGFYAEPSINPYGLQSTDMADNRLTECHLTADSVDAVFYSHRSGVPILRHADPRIRPTQNRSLNEWETQATATLHPLGYEFRPLNSTPAAGPAFDLTSTTQSLQVPDAAALDIVGDMTVIVALDTYGTGTIASKWGAAGQRSWRVSINAARHVVFGWTTGGTTEITLTSQNPLFGTGGMICVELETNTIITTHFVRFSESRDGGQTWQFLSSSFGVTSGVGSTSIFSSTAPVMLGGSTNAGTGPTSRYRSLDVRTSYNTAYQHGPFQPGGTTVLLIDAEEDVAATTKTVTATSFTASTGQTVTINGTNVLQAMTPVYYDATIPFIVSNDLEAMINDVRLARAGGTQQIAEDDISIGRWQKRITFPRSDLLNDNDTDVLAIATAIRDRRSNVTLRPAGVAVRGLTATAFSNMPALLTVDVGDLCTVTMPDRVTRVRAAVAFIDHSVTPGAAGTVWWVSQFGFDVFTEAT